MKLLVKQIHKSLIEKKKTLAVAESCTGGRVSYLLTQIPGSSQYFRLGIVAYSNKSKETVLRIPYSVIAKKGAVSKEVASQMAQRIRKLAKTDLGIGITGIAGPSGETPRKPVGTVFIAVEAKNKKICKKFHFTGSRSNIRKTASLKALELLKNML